MIGWGGARLEALDNDHTAAAGGAWEAEDPWIVILFCSVILLVWRRCVEQAPETVEIGGTLAISEQTVVANSMEPVWEDMDEKAPNELERLEVHGPLPEASMTAIVFVSERDAVFIGLDQPAIGDGHPVGVTAEIGKGCSWS